MTTDRTLALAMQVEDKAHEIYELLARGPSGPQERELLEQNFGRAGRQ